MPAFIDDQEKWRFLESCGDADARDRRVQRLAAQLDAAAGGDPRRFAELAHCYVRDCIPYQTDTARVGGEDIAAAGAVGEVIDRGGPDDCDAKARLFVALCRARSMRARMRPLWVEDAAQPSGWRLKHVFAAVWLEGDWRPVECILRRARIGEVFATVPKEANGKWMQ